MNDPRQPMNPQPVRPIGTPQQPRPVISPNPQQARPLTQPRSMQAPHAPAPHAPMQPPALKPQDEAPIALVEDAEELVEEAAPATPHQSKIVFGPDIVHRKHDWKRKCQATGAGAIRVKTFHGKLSDQGMEFMDDSINVWLDANPDIEVKFVTSTVGMYEGKFKDLALILNVWY